MKVVRNIAHAAILAAVAATLLFAACSNSSDGTIPAPVPVLPQTPAPNEPAPQTQAEEPVDPALTIPLTLEAAAANAVVTFDNKAAGPVTYKVNGGEAQTIENGKSKDITLAAVGDKVEFWGDNKTYYPVESLGSRVKISKDCYIYGNIMSLVKSENFESARTLEEPRTFSCLLMDGSNNRGLLKNKDGIDLLLPATTLTDSCYLYMFSYCKGLTRAPALPATTLTTDCYTCMFEDCTSLTSAPSLPATTMKPACYSGMFSNCQSLTKAPDLPATVLAKSCYDSMFAACISLTSAPSLPATTLEKGCYNNMFLACQSLTSVPSLPATTLAEGCYGSMFKRCTSLNSVTCLATDISASNCTTDWLLGVAATGTFTKADGMTGWPTNSASGIPSNWTVNNK